MTLLWLISFPLRNASIVDPFWGLGFVIVAWLTWYQRSATGPRSSLLLAMVTLWGLRLSLHLLWRNWGHGEDPRYAAMRQHHGVAFAGRSLFTVFWLQGVLLWLIAFPLQVGHSARIRFHLSGRSAGHPAVVRRDGVRNCGRLAARPLQGPSVQPRQVLDTGLWRYTRHPNYFGDFCVWWGLFAVAACGGAWTTIFSPLMMSFFLMFVSGVPLTEKQINQRRPEYESYRRRTNAFFPGPPRAKLGSRWPTAGVPLTLRP